MLLPRIYTAVVLFILLGGILFFLPNYIFFLTSWLAILCAANEIYKIYQFHKFLQLIISLVLFIFGMIAVSPYDFDNVVKNISIITWFCIIPIILIYKIQIKSKPFLVLMTIIIFFPAFYALVNLNVFFGSVQFVSIMAIAWVADIGAYFVGKKFGKHKLASVISPGKSIEGALGGLILVLIYLFILKYFSLITYLHNYSEVLRVGVILTLVSIIGDLFESWLKRVANVKDSGSFLPGHGGIFDRIDSLVAVLAIAFVLLNRHV